jgi:hypothetical protein
MIHLYLDTNIYLSFFGLSTDDLEELRKLVALLRVRDVTLYLPEQTEDEYRRNRPAKIAEAVAGLRAQKLTLQLPQLSKDYPEYGSIRDAQKALERAHAQLLMKLSADITASRLKADKVIAELFQIAQRIPTSQALLTRARTRHALGNPPGKRDSLGDALNWECLVEVAPDSSPFHFVTDDGDYSSPLDRSAIHPFLRDEWRNRKSYGDIVFFQRLSAFFAATFPAITLAADIEKDGLIRLLYASPSFALTHNYVAALSNQKDFSVGQLNDIVRAVVENSQVNWILTDDDVYTFVTQIIATSQPDLEPSDLAALQVLLEQADIQRQALTSEPGDTHA